MCSKHEARQTRSRLDKAVDSVLAICRDGNCEAFERFRAVGDVAGAALRNLYNAALNEPVPAPLLDQLARLGTEPTRDVSTSNE